MPHPVSISIVLPARNEATGLRDILPRILAVIPDAEVLVVDDGSTDDTPAVCAEHRVKHLRHHYAKGNGAAIKTGARAALGDVIAFMDADGQHKPEDIPGLLEEFNRATTWSWARGRRFAGRPAPRRRQ